MVFVDSSLGDGDCVVRYSRSFGKENKISLYTEIKPKGGIYLGIRARIGDQIDNDDLDTMTATDRAFFLKIGYAWTP